MDTSLVDQTLSLCTLCAKSGHANPDQCCVFDFGRFLKDLEDRMEESLIISDICDIIHYHAQHNFPAYIDYVRNQIYQEKTYSSLM